MSKPETKPLTPLRINAALVDANGNFAAAAASLGLSTERLHEIVTADVALKLRWKDAPKAPPPESIISRAEDVAIAEAVAREEKMLSEDLDGMNLSPKAKSLAVACQKFQHRNGSKVGQMVAAGIAREFLEVMVVIGDINNQLANLDVPPEQVLAWQSILREDRRGLLSYLLAAKSKVDDSILIQAKIQKMFAENGGRAEKPGFGASPLQRKPASQVIVDQPPDSPEAPK